MLDNASNNNTIIAGIEHRAAAEGISFDASWAQLRYMPHTIHLAMVKVNFQLLFNSIFSFEIHSCLKQLVQFLGLMLRRLRHEVVIIRTRLQLLLVAYMMTMPQANQTPINKI